jgi:hypothetical protein
MGKSASSVFPLSKAAVQWRDRQEHDHIRAINLNKFRDDCLIGYVLVPQTIDHGSHRQDHSRKLRCCALFRIPPSGFADDVWFQCGGITYPWTESCSLVRLGLSVAIVSCRAGRAGQKDLMQPLYPLGTDFDLRDPRGSAVCSFPEGEHVLDWILEFRALDQALVAVQQDFQRGEELRRQPSA